MGGSQCTPWSYKKGANPSGSLVQSHPDKSETPGNQIPPTRDLGLPRHRATWMCKQVWVATVGTAPEAKQRQGQSQRGPELECMQIIWPGRLPSTQEKLRSKDVPSDTRRPGLSPQRESASGNRRGWSLTSFWVTLGAVSVTGLESLQGQSRHRSPACFASIPLCLFRS